MIEDELAQLAKARVLLMVVRAKVRNGIKRIPLQESTLKDIDEIENLLIELQLSKGRR